MNLGFVIDNTACIGCHACSTACKSEHQVPLGVQRTWVKATEVGTFPDVRRTFQVTRCNHCENPPCVRICPTSAMHQRADGIVDFDSDSCIGCKACIQACPYDAIHIDPETHTAAKCNYCAHRTDIGLEPACVVVCPEHAILAGDLDDPLSEIHQAVAKRNVSVRKPEQGTSPKLFYIDGDARSMHPTAATTEGFMFADYLGTMGASSGPDHRGAPTQQGLPSTGPVGSVAAQRVGYNAQHQHYWHWPIPLYIVTKHIGAGVFFWLALGALTVGVSASQVLWAGALGLLAIFVTLGLLVYDLDRPDRFFFLLTRPQWRSWVARAAWLLTGFTTLASAWWGLELVMDFAPYRHMLAAPLLPFAVGSAVYTAFLFAQAEGRDLWQSGHIAPQMTAHALAFGAAPLALAGPWTATMAPVFAIALGAAVVITLLGDLVTPHASEVARQGSLRMTRGRWSPYFWGGIAAQGVAVVFAAAGWLGAWLALPLAAAGLFAYNLALVEAAQDVPNS